MVLSVSGGFQKYLTLLPENIFWFCLFIRTVQVPYIDTNHIMQDIANRMDDEDMRAVASYIYGLH